MPYALLWDITQHRVVIFYRNFGTTFRPQFQGSRNPFSTWISSPLKIEPTGYAETSVRNYQSTLRNVHFDRSIKIELDLGETRIVKTGRGVRQRCCFPAILFDLYSKYLIKETLERFVYFKKEDKQFRTVKYAADLVLLAMKESALQAMTEELIEIGRCMELK